MEKRLHVFAIVNIHAVYSPGAILLLSQKYCNLDTYVIFFRHAKEMLWIFFLLLANSHDETCQVRYVS